MLDRPSRPPSFPNTGRTGASCFRTPALRPVTLLRVRLRPPIAPRGTTKIQDTRVAVNLQPLHRSRFMLARRILTLLPLAVSLATAQVPTETLYPGLAGPALLEALRIGEPVPRTLGYGPARDSMYTYDQRTSGHVRCVYTGYEITISLAPGRDASTDAFAQNINAEHTFPQSQGASSEPQKSDLHNLYPTRDNVNSSRGNLPFGESPDAQTTNWYRLAATQSGIPTTAIDEYSERLGSTRWEPREDHKGNVARAMLYFAMRWPAASQAYLAGQIDDLVRWNDADPVDDAEFARMEYNARLQGNRKPVRHRSDARAPRLPSNDCRRRGHAPRGAPPRRLAQPDARHGDAHHAGRRDGLGLGCPRTPRLVGDRHGSHTHAASPLMGARRLRRPGHVGLGHGRRAAHGRAVALVVTAARSPYSACGSPSRAVCAATHAAVRGSGSPAK